MKHIIIIVQFILFSPSLLNAQKDGDKIIIVKSINDSISAYKLAKKVLVAHNFIIKDEENSNIINTYPREIKRMPGTCVIKIEIANDTFRISGLYSTKKENYWGLEMPHKSSLPIMYFEGSKTWPIMYSIAGKLGAIIRYENPTLGKKQL